jgi:hypothetical protein
MLLILPKAFDYVGLNVFVLPKVLLLALPNSPNS